MYGLAVRGSHQGKRNDTNVRSADQHLVKKRSAADAAGAAEALLVVTVL
jgi:hypothetical protein